MSIHDDIERVLISEEEIHARIAELGAQLTADYADKNPIFLGVLRGVVIFYADMVRAVPIPCEFDFMAVSSYGSGTETSGNVNITKDMSIDIKGRHVVILEDVLDTGLTLQAVVKLLHQRGPASIRICALLDKPARRRVDITADYTGFTIPNEFVVGYGLDFDDQYRNLPYVGVLKPEIYS
jgi:hypoxanthine phosphoribosyltransferase